MKKQILWVILPLLVSSCTSTASLGLVYDESVPLEKSSWICTANLGTITGYNGITVNWKKSYSAIMIQIPAGDTLLEVDVDAGDIMTTYKGKDLIFQYNFQPGKQYFMSIGYEESGDIGVNLYAYDIGESMKVSMSDYSAHHVAFTPFLNAEGNTGVGEQIILE
jgi:hypothetical protein